MLVKNNSKVGRVCWIAPFSLFCLFLLYHSWLVGGHVPHELSTSCHLSCPTPSDWLKRFDLGFHSSVTETELIGVCIFLPVLCQVCQEGTNFPIVVWGLNLWRKVSSLGTAFSPFTMPDYSCWVSQTWVSKSQHIAYLEQTPTSHFGSQVFAIGLPRSLCKICILLRIHDKKLRSRVNAYAQGGLNFSTLGRHGDVRVHMFKVRMPKLTHCVPRLYFFCVLLRKHALNCAISASWLLSIISASAKIRLQRTKAGSTLDGGISAEPSSLQPENCMGRVCSACLCMRMLRLLGEQKRVTIDGGSFSANPSSCRINWHLKSEWRLRLLQSRPGLSLRWISKNLKALATAMSSMSKKIDFQDFLVRLRARKSQWFGQMYWHLPSTRMLQYIQATLLLSLWRGLAHFWISSQPWQHHFYNEKWTLQ